MNKNKFIQIIVDTILTVMVLTFILFEELIWDRFINPIVKWLESLRIMAEIELWLNMLNPYIVLSIFIPLFILVEILGITAGAMILSGLILPGILLYTLKIPIAAVVFWLFAVTKDQLLQIGWFNKMYLWTMGVFEKLKSTKQYQTIMTKVSSVRSKFKTWKDNRTKSMIIPRIKAIYRHWHGS